MNAATFFFMLSHRFFLLLLFFLKQKTSRTGVCDVLYITRGGSGWGGRGEGGVLIFVKERNQKRTESVCLFQFLVLLRHLDCHHVVTLFSYGLMVPHGSSWFHVSPLPVGVAAFT